MCPKSYKYVLRGGKKYQGTNNKATFITSDLLPDEPQLNCRVVNFCLGEHTDPYATDIIEVRANFAQPLSLDTVVLQSGGSAIQGSTTLCFLPNVDHAKGVALPNPTNKFVVARPTNQLWEIELLDQTGALLLNSNGDQPEVWILELEFTKIDEH